MRWSRSWIAFDLRTLERSSDTTGGSVPGDGGHAVERPQAVGGSAGVVRPFEELPNDLVDGVRMGNGPHVAEVLELHDLDLWQRIHQ